MKNILVLAWNFLFDSAKSPLRHIEDIAIRHYVLQALGVMWAIAFGSAIGSYTFLAASMIGHTILIGAAAITAATYTAAAKAPAVFGNNSGRHRNGEHD